MCTSLLGTLPAGPYTPVRQSSRERIHRLISTRSDRQGWFCDIRVSPLFETIEDLGHIDQVMSTLFDNETYGQAPMLGMLVYLNPVTVVTVGMWLLVVVLSSLAATGGAS